MKIGPYIRFTEEQKRRANGVDLEEFLRLRGERLLKSGPERRLASDHSVTIRGSRWYNHAQEKGVGPVGFVQTFYRLSYPEAVSLLLGGEEGQAYPAARPEPEHQQKVSFALPPPAQNNRRGFAYLAGNQEDNPRGPLAPGGLESLPKGEFVVMKIGTHPMRPRMRLFLDYRIIFRTPYQTQERAQRWG